MIKKSDNPKHKQGFRAEQIIPVSFLLVILAGSLLLMLPFATVDGERTSFLTALFTSTTSVCVTGLVVVDTFAHWTLFGKIIILILIQLGGLGTVSVLSMIMLMLSRKFSLKERNLLQDAFNLDTRRGLFKFLKRVFRATAIIEGSGAVLYAVRFIPAKGVIKGIWYSVFHSVSAFCNAGIDILGPNSMINYNSDPFLMAVTMYLIIMGGIGFIVCFDIVDKLKEGRKKEFGVGKSLTRLSEHTKLVLFVTAFLIVGGTVFLFLAERKNTGTIGEMGLFDKWFNSLFQSVTFRTAGFATVPQENLTGISCVIGYFLMFVGGSPIGTAGGVKTVTIFIVLFNAIAFIRGRDETVIAKRRVSENMIRKAAAIVTISMFTAIIMTVLLMASEGLGIDNAAYEVVSALATVGLSRGVTGTLTSTGRLIIILCMYLGRIGPISMAIFFTKKHAEANSIAYSEGHFFVG